MFWIEAQRKLERSVMFFLYPPRWSYHHRESRPSHFDLEHGLCRVGNFESK